MIFLFFTIMIPEGTARPLLNVPSLASGYPLLVQQNVNAAGPVPVLIAAGFNQPDGLALDSNGSIYISEDAGRSVKVIQHYPNGSFSSAADVVVSGTYYNRGLATDQSNNLYFVSYWGGYVDELPVGCHSTSCLQTLVNVGGDNVGGPRGVGVDSHGYVWFTTTWGGRV